MIIRRSDLDEYALPVDGRKISNIRYANVSVLIAEEMEIDTWPILDTRPPRTKALNWYSPFL